MAVLQARRYQPFDADLTAVAASSIAAPWTAYTPVVTAAAGTFTTVSATGRYLALGKLVLVEMSVNITTNGTAATSVLATLPSLGNSAASYCLCGRANNVSGKMLQGFIFAAAANVHIFNYDNTYPGANGESLVLNGFYETV